MLKKLFLTGLLFFTPIIWGNLYLRTEFFQAKAKDKKPVITKHHIFLNKPYDFRYWDRRYIITLKKIDKNEFQIETETYNIKPLKYEQISGSIAYLHMGSCYSLEEKTNDLKTTYKLNICPEKVVVTSP